MRIVSMKALLESGVHFGHRTHKWHPAMKPYIFTERNNIHIIDLQKTVKALEEAYNLVRDTIVDGGTILFVGTKRQAQDTIEMDSLRCGMPSVTARWLGGTLTNWRTIRLRINELERLERMRDQGDFARITKKEALGLTRKIARLEMLLGGIRNMVDVPDLLFVVDIRREETAVHEANLLEIPVLAMVDTNCDPKTIDYIIPSNDDAIRAIKLIVGKMADAVLEGQAMRKDLEAESEAAKEAIHVDEPELSDDDLLGAATLATLAKLEARRSEEDAQREVQAALSEDDAAVEEEDVSDEIVVVEDAAIADESAEETAEEVKEVDTPEEEPTSESGEEGQELEEDAKKDVQSALSEDDTAIEEKDVSEETVTIEDTTLVEESTEETAEEVEEVDIPEEETASESNEESQEPKEDAKNSEGEEK